MISKCEKGGVPQYRPDSRSWPITNPGALRESIHSSKSRMRSFPAATSSTESCPSSRVRYTCRQRDLSPLGPSGICRHSGC